MIAEPIDLNRAPLAPLECEIVEITAISADEARDAVAHRIGLAASLAPELARQYIMVQRGIWIRIQGAVPSALRADEKFHKSTMHRERFRWPPPLAGIPYHNLAD